MDKTQPATHHSTHYSYCNDIVAMRSFYIDILGFAETYYDEAKGWLTFDSGLLNMVFIQSDELLDVQSDWAKQPTFQDGVGRLPSWVVSIADKAFDDTVQRIQAADFMLHSAKPTSPQPGHRLVWVRDPMGTTIELYAVAD